MQNNFLSKKITMFSSDRALIVAVYGIYLFDCLHWLEPQDIAVTRGLLGGWHHWEVSDLSFTLLGRLPVFSNPIDFRAGFFRSVKRATGGESGLDLSDSELNGVCSFGKTLPLSCLAGGVLLLVVVPLVVELGWLPMLWKPLLAGVISLHTLIVVEFIRQADRWKTLEPNAFWKSLVSLCLNPLGSLRAGDVLSENIGRLLVEGRQFSKPTVPS